MKRMSDEDKAHLVRAMKFALDWEGEQWTEEHPWPAAGHEYMIASCAVAFLEDYASTIPLVMAVLIRVATTHHDDSIQSEAFHSIHQVTDSPDWNAVMGCLLDHDHVNDGACHVGWHAKPYYEETAELFRLLRPQWVEAAGI